MVGYLIKINNNKIYIALIRCWTGCQCSWHSSGLVWDRLGAWTTIRAALFWTCCSF